MFGNYRFDLETIIDAVEQDGYDLGYCTNCGTEYDGIEPDAKDYMCEYCCEMGVFGVDVILQHILEKKEKEQK